MRSPSADSDAESASASEYEQDALEVDSDPDEGSPVVQTPSSSPTKRKRAGASTSPRTPPKRARTLHGIPTPPSSDTKARVQAVHKNLQRVSSGASLHSSTGSWDQTLLTSGQRDVENHRISLATLNALTPHQRAKRLLQVGHTPDCLPGREREFDEIYKTIASALHEHQNGCIYVPGVPGSGKTATVRSVIRRLRQDLNDSRLKVPFNFIEINGMKLGDPSQAYSQLWQAISSNGNDKRRSPKFALKALTSYFSGQRPGNKVPPSPGRWRTGNTHSSTAEQATVVLLDELDQLIHTHQDVVYNFFNWPTLPRSRLIVVAIANQMNLPETQLLAKISSRAGMTRVIFEPYKTEQLETIVRARLGIKTSDNPDEQALPAVSQAVVAAKGRSNLEQAKLNEIEKLAKKDCGDIFHPDAIKLAAKKTAPVSGDARRMLDICRRAIELVEARAEALLADDEEYAKQSRGPARRSTRSLVTAASKHAQEVSKRCGPIKPQVISDVIAAMVKNGLGAQLRCLSLGAQILLVAVLHCARRKGISEVRLGDVLVEQRNLFASQALKKDAKLAQSAGSGDWNVLSNLTEIDWALSNLCQLGLVHSIGSGAGPGRAGIHARIELACSEEDVRLALQEIPDKRINALL
ncbi:Origin recognition complex, subunit 1 [Tilletia horrida]|uniref:Origin recognition complex subunit 1 n=1 Tax=Tilletia horrida TaxID=155126 RepID=A0AAN6GPV3_9BASI|nr:Origin recognition complex, subunit 1 [Tilletia horrida]